MASDRPLLLVDVDGVLSLFGFDPAAPPPGRGALIDGVPHLLSAQAAECLRAVAPLYEPVWCTGWEDRADEHLPFLLGLEPGWPHIPLKAAKGPGHSVAGHWKLDAIDAFAGRDRPLAWIDDHLDAACTAWAQARPGATLLVPVAPAKGLTLEEEMILREFARAHTRPS